MNSVQNHFFDMLISSRKISNDGNNEVTISRKYKVKQIQIKRKNLFHLQSRRKLVHEFYINKKI